MKTYLHLTLWSRLPLKVVLAWCLVLPIFSSLQANCNLLLSLTLFISSARFSWRNLSVSGLVIFADFLRQGDKYRNTCMPPSTNILAYPIDSVANIVNSIKDDKIGKRAKFCILDELQHFRNVLFGLFARSSDSSPNRLFTTSLFTHAPKEKKRAKWSRSMRGGGSGSGSHEITRK